MKRILPLWMTEDRKIEATCAPTAEEGQKRPQKKPRLTRKPQKPQKPKKYQNATKDSVVVITMNVRATKDVTLTVRKVISSETIRKNMAIVVRHQIEDELEDELDDDLETDFTRAFDAISSNMPNDKIWREHYGKIYNDFLEKRCRERYYSLLQTTRDTSDYQHDVYNGYRDHSIDDLFSGKRINYSRANYLRACVSHA